MFPPFETTRRMAEGLPRPARKRRRQAVVCTSCRRRKIACDRNQPCAQCALACLECTYQHYHVEAPIGKCEGDPARAPVDSRRPPSGTRVQAQPPRQATHAEKGPWADMVFGNVEQSMTALLNVDTTSLGQTSDILNVGAHDRFEVDMLNMYEFQTWEDSDGAARIPSLRLESTNPSVDSEPSGGSQLSLLTQSWTRAPTHWITIMKKVPRPFSYLNCSSAAVTDIRSRANKYERCGIFDSVTNILFSGAGHPLLQQCKALARQVKAKGPSLQASMCLVADHIPPRDVSDKLLELYLTTFEAIFRVLQVPIFKRKYQEFWDEPHVMDQSFVTQLLLVLAIGACFYNEVVTPKEESDTALRDKAPSWIYACHLRLSSSLRKERLSLSGVQSSCLLIIALLTNTSAIGGDLLHNHVASLVQNAMGIGLHRMQYPLTLSPMEVELRRRLWATVVELVVQCSLDSGQQPMLPSESLTFQRPLNLDDNELEELANLPSEGHPATLLTGTSLQLALLQSLPARLRIAELLAKNTTEVAYAAAVRLGDELTAACRDTSSLIDAFSSPFPRPSVESPFRVGPSKFQVKLVDLLSKRFLLLLHAQFAAKAHDDITYHFSRSACLDCSLLVLAPPASPLDTNSQQHRYAVGERHPFDGFSTPSREEATRDGEMVDEYLRLQLYGSSIFKNTFLVASLLVCAEVLLQLRENSSPATVSLLRPELLNAVEHAVRSALQRIAAGDNNTKAAACFSCVRAQIASRHKSQCDTNTVIAGAALTTLQQIRQILESRLLGFDGSWLGDTE